MAKKSTTKSNKIKKAEPLSVGRVRVRRSDVKVWREVPRAFADAMRAHVNYIEAPEQYAPSPITRQLHRYWQWPSEAYDLHDCDLTNFKFRYVRLHKADFKGANLGGVSFTQCLLTGCDFTGADLRDASLDLNEFASPTFRNVDLRGGFLRNNIMYYGDFVGARMSKDTGIRDNFGITNFKPVFVDEERDYIMYVFKHLKGGPRIIMGCRNFSLQEAYDHWRKYDPEHRPGYVDKVIALAKQYGITLKLKK